MLNKRIEYLREQLNQMVLKKKLSSKRLLKKSRALDRLIVEVMLSKAENPRSIKATSGKQQFINDSIKGSLASGQLLEDNSTGSLFLQTIWTD